MDHKLPKKPLPKPQVGTQLKMIHPASQMSYDLQSFDNLLRSQGVKIRHYRAMPDPTALHEAGDLRRDIPWGDTDGQIYHEAGSFTGTFYTNENTPVFEVNGELDASSAMITPPRFYDNTEEPVLIDVFDRFEFCDIEVKVIGKQLVETSSIGLDRLAFQAVKVENLVGSDGFEYKEGEHFRLTSKGDIEWISQIRPKRNTQINKGEVYSIRYRYIPYFVVRRLVHEVRVAQVTGPTGERIVHRLPYQVQVARENVFRDKRRYSDAPREDPRFQNLPPSGTIVGGD